MEEKIFAELDGIREEFMELSRNIHENPETCFEEYKSSRFIMDLLSKHGFDIEEKAGGIDTAFKATYEGKETGPTVAFLAEYDALPNIGHGCGHNLIAAAATGAAIALSKIMGELPGSIVLLGTPAEEGGGGKILLLERGVFDDIDYSLMAHPSTEALIGRGGLATTDMKLEYHGRAAHSASPENGINALQSVIQTFNLIDSIRACFPLKSNVNGIITNGGQAANIIPDYASCTFSVRSGTFTQLKEVVGDIKKAIRAVETLTGAQASVKTGKAYSERYPNLAIAETYKKYMELQGETVNYPDPEAKIGSSDIGNVTLKMPAIHAYFKIAEKDVVAHTKDFTAAAITDRAHESTLKTSKALACTAYELLMSKDLREKSMSEFKNKVPVYESLELE